MVTGGHTLPLPCKAPRIYGGISCDWNHTDGADKVED